MNLRKQSYASGISSEVFGAVELRVLWLQRSPCLRSYVVLLSHSPIVNKENSSSNLVLCIFHVYWLMNMFVYIINMLFL